MSVKPTYEEIERFGRQADITIENLEQKLAESQCEFRAADATIENLQIQLNAEREAKLALAAENAQMLRLLTDISENHDEYVNQDEYLYAGIPMDYVSEINSYVSRDVEAENPFKETDAFLAEVRASAVDEVCLKISNAIINCYQDEMVWLDEAATICGDFAAEIRKGVQS